MFQTSTFMDPHPSLPLEDTSIARAPSDQNSSRPVMASLNVSNSCTAVPEIPVQDSLSRRPKRKTKPLNKCHREIQWTTVKQLKTNKTYALRSGEAVAWQQKHHNGAEDNQSELTFCETSGETTLTTQRKELVKQGIKKQKGTHGPLQNDGIDPFLAYIDPHAAKPSEESCEGIRKSLLDSGTAGKATLLPCIKASNDTATKWDRKEGGEQKIIFPKQAIKTRQAGVQEIALTQPEGKNLALELQLPPDMGCRKSNKHESSIKQAKGQNNKAISEALTTLNEPHIMEWLPCNTRAVKNNVMAMSNQKAKIHDRYIATDLIAPKIVKAAKMKAKTDVSSAQEEYISVPDLASRVFPKITPDEDSNGISLNICNSEDNAVANIHYLAENKISHVSTATKNSSENGYFEQMPVQKLHSPHQDPGSTSGNKELEAENMKLISADTVKHIICEVSTDKPQTMHGHVSLLTCNEWADQAELPVQNKNDARLSISHLGSKTIQGTMTEQTLTRLCVPPSTDHSSAVDLTRCNSATFRSVKEGNSCGFVSLPDCGKWGSNAAQLIQCMNDTRSSIVPHESRPAGATMMKHLMALDPCAASTDCNTTPFQQGSSSNTTSTVSDDDRNETPLSEKHCNSDYYIEETAWRYFGDAAPASYCVDEGGDLIPLLPPPPLSKFPQTGYCTWTFDEQSRVVLGSFQNEGESVVVNDEDREFLFDMMERNDITVITEGHANELNHDIWSLAFIKGRVGTDYHHKFRRFIRQLPATETSCQPPLYKEVDGYLTMKVADYIDYLFKRSSAMLKGASQVFKGDNLDFVYTDVDGKEMELHLLHDVVYMIDYDIIRMLPELYEDLLSNLKIPECLPGGQKCMMNAVCTFSLAVDALKLLSLLMLHVVLQVNQNGRPFMGPNLYMTRKSILVNVVCICLSLMVNNILLCKAGGSFTAVHQDGFGTVDSGHLCLSGFNEVS